jgi:hypothetical protein
MPVRRPIEIKLYLDEDVNPQLARDLRNRGYDAVSTIEVNNLGLSDREQLEYARLYERALLTHNRDDFLEIASAYATRKPTITGYSSSHRLPMASCFNASCSFWQGQVRRWRTCFFGFHNRLLGEPLAEG